MTKSLLDTLVDRFLCYPLPTSVKPDPCAMNPKHPHRTGTNLLTATEAREVLGAILGSPWPIPYDQHEAEILKVIDERDAAEEALAQAYYLVMGHSAEWSNAFGHAEALEEIGDAVAALKLAVKPQA